MIIQFSPRVRIRTDSNNFIVETSNAKGNWSLDGYHGALHMASRACLEAAVKAGDDEAQASAKELARVLQIATNKLAHACELACDASSMTASLGEETIEVGVPDDLFDVEV